MSAAYEIAGLEHHFDGRTVLRLDHLTLPQGAILGLVGPNGTGKTTLLSIMAFLLKPTHGTVRFLGREHPDATWARRQVTLLLQSPYLLKRSVFENVAYGLKVRGEARDAGQLAEKVAEALDMVALDPAKFQRRRWYELSGGEAQRVSLASRLIFRPKVLLLDEPTASLDQTSAVRVQQAAIDARARYGTTVVVASHDHAWLAGIADQTVTLAYP